MRPPHDEKFIFAFNVADAVQFWRPSPWKWAVQRWCLWQFKRHDPAFRAHMKGMRK